MTEIKATEIVDTTFGKKVVLDSPYEAKQFIKFMPWSADDTVNYDELEEGTETPEFEFSDDFECHSSWDSDAYAWEIDLDSFGEAKEFFESVGIEVTVESDVALAAE